VSPSSSGLIAERMRVRVLSAPLADAVPMSFGRLANRQVCLVEVEAGGVTGVGESWVNYPAWAPTERVATLCEGIAPLLLGMEVSDPVEVQQRLSSELVPLGRQWGAVGPVWQAISAVDLALWDLCGKAADVPTARLLAGSDQAAVRGRLPAYASGVGPTLVTQLCEKATAAGFSAVKLKVGFDEATDRATLAAARGSLGRTDLLFADANQAWDLETATRRCDLLAEHDVAWLEEPIAGDDLGLLEKLAMDSAMPLATGENLYGMETFRRYVDSPAVQVIQPDLAKAGGLTLGREVAALASRADTAVAPHCYSSGVGVVAMLQLASAFETVRWLELDVRDNPLRTDLFVDPLRLVEGHLLAPDGPGFGVELSPDALGRFQIHMEERTTHDF